MKTKMKLLLLGSGILFLESCSNYHQISENDVYSQRPTELSADEDETDLTSFDAFKARERGAYGFQYDDPYVNQRSAYNRYMLMSSYMPFGMPYRWYGGADFYGGMGFNSYPYMGYRFGYPNSSMYGDLSYWNATGGMFGPSSSSYYYNSYYYGGGFYGPYGYPYGSQYGYGHGPFSPYYPYSSYGGGYGGTNYQPQANNDNVYYGHRTGVIAGGNSNRSSSYPVTTTKSLVTSGNVAKNDQTAGSSRRNAGASYTGGNNPVSPKGQANTVGNQNASSVARRANIKQNYQPNASLNARRGVVSTSNRNVNTTRVSSSPSNRVAKPAGNVSNQNRHQTISRQNNNYSSPSRVSPSRSSSPASPSGSQGSSSRRR